jgi:CRP/FNR family cyclic AMP-dependent transcriptional regulator
MSNAILELCWQLPMKEVAEGEVILEEGVSHTDRLYVLKEGEVEITRGGARIATAQVPGTILGEMSYLLKRPHSATVRALSPVRLLVVEDPEAFFSQSGVGIAVARVLAARLNSLGRMVSDIRGQPETERADAARMHEVLRRLESAASGG